MNRLVLWPRASHLAALAAAIGLGLLTGSRPTPAAAATNQLAFSPPSATIAVGGSVSIDITVANVSNLGGYNLELQFNPAVVHLTSLVDSGFVGNNSNPNNIVVCNAATINNSAGTAIDSCATQAIFGPPGPGVSATTPVALMHASFTGVAAGTSPLTMPSSVIINNVSYTTLLDPFGVALVPAPALGTGSITVTIVASVGGIAEEPDLAALPSTSSPAYHARSYALAVTAFVAAATVLFGATWWGARRMRARIR